MLIKKFTKQFYFLYYEFINCTKCLGKVKKIVKKTHNNLFETKYYEKAAFVTVPIIQLQEIFYLNIFIKCKIKTII